MTQALKDAVLLLGGSGSRLGLLTQGVNKHLLPVYDRPLAARAAQFLIRQGINRIAAVASADDISLFARLFQHPFTNNAISYVAQPAPTGTADAIRRGARSLHCSQFVVLFGDNIFLDDFVPDFSGLSPGVDVRCFVRWMDDGLEQLAVVNPGPHGQNELLRSPHSISRGHVLAGLFVIRLQALDEFSLSNGSPHGQEDDILAFIAACLSGGQCEIHKFDTPWYDAGYSHEALWQAGLAVRSSEVERVSHRDPLENR